MKGAVLMLLTTATLAVAAAIAAIGSQPAPKASSRKTVGRKAPPSRR
jgi:hypothetical protein